MLYTNDLQNDFFNGYTKIALLVISIGILEMNGLVRLAFSVPLFAATKAEKAFGFRGNRVYRCGIVAKKKSSLKIMLYPNDLQNDFFNEHQKVVLLGISICFLETNGLVRLAFSVPLFAATKAEKAFGFRDI